MFSVPLLERFLHQSYSAQYNWTTLCRIKSRTSSVWPLSNIFYTCFGFNVFVLFSYKVCGFLFLFCQQRHFLYIHPQLINLSGFFSCVYFCGFQRSSLIVSIGKGKNLLFPLELSLKSWWDDEVSMKTF